MTVLDGRIPLGVQQPRLESPMNMLAQAFQLKDAQQSSQLNALKFQELQRSTADDAALRADLAQPGADPYKMLVQRGRLKDANEFAKGQQEIEKSKGETAKNKQELLTKRVALWRDSIANINDAESATVLARAMYNDPDLKDSPITARSLDSLLSEIPKDPAQFGGWKQQFALGATKFIELNKPNTSVRNTGGTTDVLQTPGLGGPAQVVSSVQNTASPGELLTDRRQRDVLAETTRHHRVTEGHAAITANAPRGQFIETTNGYVLADPKTGTVRPVTGADGQPLKGKAADRQMTDSQAKANLFGSRMKESDRILSDIEGKYSPMAVNTKMGADSLPVVGGLAGPAANRLLSTQGQQAEQAQRDFINAVLRRESGAVISEPEFLNARKQYFPEPGDGAEKLEQKRRNRQLAIAGMEAEVPGGFRGGQSPGARGGADNDPLGIRR
jgi:hypothetical protein